MSDTVQWSVVEPSSSADNAGDLIIDGECRKARWGRLALRAYVFTASAEGGHHALKLRALRRHHPTPLLARSLRFPLLPTTQGAAARAA